MTSTITIAGRSFNFQPRYAEGHTLTANEASALNQTLAENLRNNFASKAKEGADQASFDEYAASYQFGVRTGGGSRDPVMAEAMDIARDSVKDAIRKAGKKLSDYTAKAISVAAEKLINHAAKGPEIMELAKQRVAQLQANASSEVDDDLLSSLEAAQAEVGNDSAGEAGEISTDAPASSGRKGKAAA